MKSLLSICWITIICLCSCAKDIETIQNTGDKKQSSNTPSFIEYTILKGNQYCDKSSFVPIKLKQLSFKVKFDSSAIYTTSLANNQPDINKLFGFSDNNATHHEFSARFGWRWSDNALHIFAYDYNNDTMSFKELGTVEIGNENICSIKVSGDKYIFDLNGAETIMPRASTTEEAEGYQLFPYFGGDESAPHKIVIWIEQL